MKIDATNPVARFKSGLVFGFDIGTGSIGWAVRRGSEFLDVGVLICPEETTKLDSRRSLRRQRRTLRSKKYRRRWFARELAALLGLKLVQHNGQELPLPDTAWALNANGGWVPKPGFESLRDPVALRVAAAAGRPLITERGYVLTRQGLDALRQQLHGEPCGTDWAKPPARW
jgi:hypothetical protein